MAPRGGGRHSSGGSSSSGNSYSSTYSDNVWLDSTELPGSGWHDGALVALTVFDIIFFIITLGVFFWRFGALRRSRHIEGVTSVLGFKRFGLCIFVGLFFYTFNMISAIITESQATVEYVWFIIQTIFLSTTYINEILLFFTIYTLLLVGFRHPMGTSDAKNSLKRTIFMLHALFCLVLFLLYLVEFGLSVAGIVETIGGAGDTNALVSSNGIPHSVQIDTTITALFFVASVEIMAATLFLFVVSSKHELPKKVSITIMLLIAFPLFLREVINLAFEGAFGLNVNKYPTLSEYAGLSIVSELCRCIVFIGIVLVCSQLGQLGFRPAVDYNGNGPMAPGPQGVAPAKSPETAQSPYPQPSVPNGYVPPEQQHAQYPHQQHTPMGGSPPPQQQQYAPNHQHYPAQNASPPPAQPYSAQQNAYSPPPPQ